MQALRMVPGLVLDTNSVLTDALLDHPAMSAYGGFFRYVPHVGAAGAGDITAAEVERIMRRKKGLGLVQHVRVPPWNPARFSGHDDAMAAVSRAYAVGYPKGAHIFADLEGIEGTGTKTWANDWADAIVSEGYRAGTYVGYSVPLTPEELYKLHRMTSYWSDAGTRQVAVRGFALKQKAQIFIGGVAFDPDIVTVDHKGETPFWAVSNG